MLLKVIHALLCSNIGNKLLEMKKHSNKSEDNFVRLDMKFWNLYWSGFDTSCRVYCSAAIKAFICLHQARYPLQNVCAC